MANPLRKVYTTLISKILNGKKTTNSRLVLYRLDQDNVLIRDKRNVTGMAIGAHRDHIAVMSIKFYHYLCQGYNRICCNDAYYSYHDLCRKTCFCVYARQIRAQ